MHDTVKPRSCLIHMSTRRWCVIRCFAASLCECWYSKTHLNFLRYKDPSNEMNEYKEPKIIDIIRCLFLNRIGEVRRFSDSPSTQWNWQSAELFKDTFLLCHLLQRSSRLGCEPSGDITYLIRHRYENLSK